MKWIKKIYLDWVHKFKAEVAKLSRQSVEFSSFYKYNIYVISKEIAVIKICKIAKEGSKWAKELLNEAILHNILGSNAQR